MQSRTQQRRRRRGEWRISNKGAYISYHGKRSTIDGTDDDWYLHCTMLLGPHPCAIDSWGPRENGGGRDSLTRTDRTTVTSQLHFAEHRFAIISLRTNHGASTLFFSLSIHLPLSLDLVASRGIFQVSRQKQRFRHGSSGMPLCTNPKPGA